MGMFGTKATSSKYHAEITTGEWPAKGSEAVTSGSDEQVQKWASDPDCIEQEQAAAHMQWRLAERAKRKQELASKRQELQDNPFDPRTEVSADANILPEKLLRTCGFCLWRCLWSWSYSIKFLSKNMHWTGSPRISVIGVNQW